MLTVLAAVLRLYRLSFGYAHGVFGYDEGVYLGSSLELFSGRLPYRDYVLVHPPGITLVFAPLALVAKVAGTAQAMGLAKILTALAGTAGVPLMARLVRHRGTSAVALACGVVAFQGDAVASGYAPLLEPWVVLFCLLGALLVFDGDRIATGRRLWWGGVLLGVGCATKIWAFAVVLALVVAIGAARGPGLRRAGRALSGVAVGFLVPVLPFAVLAPRAFVHDVFVVQLFRSSAGPRTSVTFRLLHLFSVGPPDGDLPVAGRAWLVAGALLVAVALVGVWSAVLRGASPLERFAAAAAVLIVAMLFVPGTFYWHYAAFAAPFLALAAVLPLGGLRRREHRRSARAWTAVLALCVVGLAATMLHRDVRHYGLHDEYAEFARLVPAGSCVVTTQPATLIADDRYPSGAGCPTVVDPFGAALAYSNGQAPSASSLLHPRLVAMWAAAYRGADYVYFARRHSPTVPPSRALQRYLTSHFHVVAANGLQGTLYERDR